MIDPTTLGLFCAAALALLVVPGPSVLYIVARSIEQGRSVGLLSTLGVHVGTLVHIAAAVFGVSALVVSSATAFDAVRYAGAVYLVVLGVRALLGRGEAAGDGAPTAPGRRVFANAVLVQVLNPKTALFFLAFLPQFVDPSAGHVGLQLTMLGLVFVVLGLVSDGSYALVAGTVGGRLRRAGWFRSLGRYVSGSVFIGLGVAAAVSGSRKPS